MNKGLQAALVAGLMSWASTSDAKKTLHCAVHPQTDAAFCFAQEELSSRGSARFAPIYQGGPKRVTSSGWTAQADCAARVLRLRDRDGVVFAAGRFTDTAMLNDLGTAMCQVEPGRPAKR